MPACVCKYKFVSLLQTKHVMLNHVLVVITALLLFVDNCSCGEEVKKGLLIIMTALKN